ncbi:sigma-70 family RNA polymerase sigma factor [Sphaerisporangium sp. TRM90804]|uniref:RNA polymerase sigma factor n=1 Tax=Sphaerisporangium sp. TRM90804 TaxID=3031113 RepID=UPI002447B13C|nr:sigma-70 family RNA polymerase sigma factor [Sphaerisporangium sp. TRM90804]MDH2428264.1 sigma-70 family RNA polymerase sigma factor [Sphaerisporangium sp. TRM90804]
MPYDHGFPDEIAWRGLVERFGYRMWAVARAYGLSPSDAADAVQAAWLRLVENYHSVRDLDRLGAWLVTTTRHEAIRIGKKRGDQLPGLPDDLPASDGDPVAVMLTEDEGRRLWAAVDTLREPCRSLLRLLVTAPEAGYAQISRRLDMPIGSIGPTRGRCLKRLRSIMEEQQR